MNQLERVEKIREKTGVTYEGGKRSIGGCRRRCTGRYRISGKSGEDQETGKQVYTSKPEQDTSMELIEAAKTYETEDHESFGDIVKKFLKWCGRMIKKGCENFLYRGKA